MSLENAAKIMEALKAAEREPAQRCMLNELAGLVQSDGEVIDGHLRLKAARRLGITHIPVILCDEWTPAQVKAFRLLVNPVGDLGCLGRRTADTGTDGAEDIGLRSVTNRI